MAEGFNTSPFILPQMFQPPGQALEDNLRRQDRQAERQYEIDYRNQRNKEADDWKKLQLIQELTDLDKYQTGEQAADAIGFRKAQEIMQKFTAQAGSMTPAELQYKISQEIGKTTIGMQAMKDELVQSESKIQQYKRMYPSLNDAELKRMVRADILGRRISGSEFANITDANQPSQLNLDDPDFISDFIDVNKGLKDAVVNPKNIQKGVNVLRGTPSSYVNYEADLPFYMKDDFQTQGGFYNQKEEPTMSLKTSTIPQGAFSGANQDIDVLDEGSFSGLLSEGAEVEPALRKLAKTKYRNYSSMSNSEKEIAMRDVAKDFITPYAANYKYRSKSATKPPHYSNTTVNNNGTGANINDIAGRINATISADAANGYDYTRFNKLKADEGALIVKYAKDNGYEIDPSKVILHMNSNGETEIYEVPTKTDKDGNSVPDLNNAIKPSNLKITLPGDWANVPVQANTKSKDAAVKKANAQQSNTGGKNEISINDIPTGTKLEQKGNDYYYKGKKVNF